MTALRQAARWGVTTALVLVVVSVCSAAALLAAARSSDAVHRREIELVSFTPLGLPFAVVGVLAAVILGVRHGRALGVSVAVPCVALAALHASWLAPLYVGPVPDPSDGPRLVVMTQNFEYGDADDLVHLVDHHKVEVLVLTDAPADQMEAVRAAGVEDDLLHTTVDDRTGSVIWSRYPILSSAFISDGGDSRLVTIEVPEIGEVDLVALHPTPPYQEQGDKWTADWSRILATLRDSYGPTVEGNVVLAGDLNATLDHSPLRSLADMGFRDAAEQLNRGRGPTWPANGTHTRLGITVPALLALDHVLTADGLVATDQVVTGDVGSDHRAVIVTLGLAAR